MKVFMDERVHGLKVNECNGGQSDGKKDDICAGVL